MWTIQAPNSLVIDEWLQKRDHMDAPEGECFVLLTDYNYDMNKEYLPYNIQKDTVVYHKDGYTVLAYDSAEQIMK